jgi:hypothetical protein
VLLLIVLISAVVLFGLVPVLSKQLTDVIRELPDIIQNIQEQLLRLPQSYPDIFTAAQVNDLINSLRNELASFTQSVLEFSLARLGTLVMIAVYVVLVPIMIFFTLKDKDKLLTFARTFVPKRSELTFQVWREVDAKIANYIRGKFGDLHPVCRYGIELLIASEFPSWPVRDHPLCRSSGCNGAYCANRFFPMGLCAKAWLFVAGLSGCADIGW